MDSALVNTLDGRGARFAAPYLPVAEILLGQPVEDAAALLPRLFGLCGAAHGLAIRLSLGLSVTASHHDALRREVLRDHLAKLRLRWPALLGLPVRALPAGWGTGKGLRDVLFGGTLPQDAGSFTDWLRTDRGVAPVISSIARAFAPDEAVVTLLPLVGSNGRRGAGRCGTRRGGCSMRWPVPQATCPRRRC